MTGFPFFATTRRDMLRVCISISAFGFPALLSGTVVADDLSKKFEFLAQNGNSNCSQVFLEFDSDIG